MKIVIVLLLNNQFNNLRYTFNSLIYKLNKKCVLYSYS